VDTGSRKENTSNNDPVPKVTVGFVPTGGDPGHQDIPRLEMIGFLAPNVSSRGV
jgi:hypothetical protein